MAPNQMFLKQSEDTDLLAKVFNLSLKLDSAPNHWHTAISFKKKKKVLESDLGIGLLLQN